MHLVETKAREGKIEAVETQTEDTERKSADVIDLTELLKRSLAGKGSSSKSAAKPAAKSSSKGANAAPAKRRAPARKKTTKAS
jgi:DNA end-binding protein Ku